MTISSYDIPPGLPGPTARLAEVFGSYERRGHRDPVAAWEGFTATWNWTASLPIAAARTGPGPTPAARPVSGGFSLSGQWMLPSGGMTGDWAVLPLADGPPESADTAVGPDGPDLYVVAADTLAGVVAPEEDASGRVAPAGRSFRLTDVYVPAGFVTYTAAAPLAARDAPFLWTAVAGLALGASRRMTDEQPGGLTGADGPRGVPGSAREELAGILHDERLGMAAALYGCPATRQGLPVAQQERLAARVGQVANTVHHVLAAAYQQALAAGGDTDRHPLVRVIEESAPILQQVRYATQLLPPHDTTARGKAEYGDDRRISG